MTVYRNIFQLVAYFKNIISRTQDSLKILNFKQSEYYWVDDSDSLPVDLEWANCGKDFPSGRLMLMDACPGLFRGQIDVYSPCYSKAYRGFPSAKRPRELPEEFRVKFLASQAKTLWYLFLLKKHPSMHRAKTLNIKTNPFAIAQHYGMTTSYLDLTESIEIASFFACCECKDNVWCPKSTGKGVIYFLNSLSVPRPIGLVTFSRPVSQKAWFVFLPLGVDFEELPQVKKFVFNHTPEGSRYYLRMFNSGNDLFPEDPAADIAKDIANSDSIPKDFIVETLLRFGCVPENVEKTLPAFKNNLNKYCNLAIKDSVPIDFTDNQIKIAEVCLVKHSEKFNDFRGWVRPVCRAR
jgi:hypothetical protein